VAKERGRKTEKRRRKEKIYDMRALRGAYEKGV